MNQLLVTLVYIGAYFIYGVIKHATAYDIIRLSSRMALNQLFPRMYINKSLLDKLLFADHHYKNVINGLFHSTVFLPSGVTTVCCVKQPIIKIEGVVRL